jgi:transposase
LFAALDVLTGTVIGQCLPRHRHQEFVKFLRTIDREIPKELTIHLIVDNYATHKHPIVRTWLAKHPRFQLHFTPTSSSWLNLVERWFRELTDKALRREAALLRAGTDPADRLRSIVGVHVGRHAKAPLESLLGNTELRSLEPVALEVVITKRDVQQRMFERVVVDGVERGVFTAANPVDAARFVVSACTAVATWFRPDGPLTADEIVVRYQRIALDAVGYCEPLS